MKKREEQKLIDIVAQIVEGRRDQIRISPAWIATEVMKKLDPKRRSQPLVYLGCHLQVRQIAREHLRNRFMSNEKDGTQHELFSELQPRYPTARSKNKEEPEYILRDEMSDEDIDYNIHRLEEEAKAKQAHADALRAFKRRRKRVA